MVLHDDKYISDEPAGRVRGKLCLFLRVFFFFHVTDRDDPLRTTAKKKLLLRASVRGAGGRGDGVSWEGERAGGLV